MNEIEFGVCYFEYAMWCKQNDGCGGAEVVDPETFWIGSPDELVFDWRRRDLFQETFLVIE